MKVLQYSPQDFILVTVRDLIATTPHGDGTLEVSHVTNDDSRITNKVHCDNKSASCSFDDELQGLWEAAVDSGICRYKLSKNCLPSKVLPGRFNYIAQLNPDRAQKRREPQGIQSVNQPFNRNEFNFNKVESNEILLRLHPQHRSQERVEDEHLLIVNVSPLEYGHVLLTPHRGANQAQCVTREGLQLALELLLLSKSCDFRVGFNSLCGFASVNHEHFHAYYLSHRLYVEHASLELVTKNCFQLADPRFPPGFCFLLDDLAGKDDEALTHALDCFLRSALKLTNHLQSSNVAHNVYITRGSRDKDKNVFDCVRVYVWARSSSYGAKGCEAFNPALCELAGHFPIKNQTAYDNLSEELVLKELHYICDESFMIVRDWITSNF